MGTRIYQVQCWTEKYDQEFDTREDAVMLAETLPHAQMITFFRQPNMPNRLPAFVDKCVGLDVWQNNAWREVNIWGEI